MTRPARAQMGRWKKEKFPRELGAGHVCSCEMVVSVVLLDDGAV